MYGTVDAANLFYDSLSSFLTDKLKFKKNAYDPCVVNRVIENKQCTIMWHVDDLQISHANLQVVSSIIEARTKEYGDIMPLTISRGKVHDYLGMVLIIQRKDRY